MSTASTQTNTPVAAIVRVLVVDDSAYVRKMVTQMLSRSPFVEVVGTARDGLEALEMAGELSPDVISTCRRWAACALSRSRWRGGRFRS